MANLAKLGYHLAMRTVNIGELKNQLSGYLQYVKNGEEIVIRDRSVPVARILPFRHGAGWDQEAQLVASGAMKMPEEEMDWNQFFLAPAGNVPHEVAVEVAIDSRGDR
jgi:prevent-host-death family protein